MAVGPPGGPPEPWHRRYWGYSNQPFPGCGCLWVILVILVVWWLIAEFAYPGWRVGAYGWW